MYLPENFDELKQITGFGDYKISKYGANFLRVIKQYADEHNLVSKMEFKKPKKEKRPSSAKKDKTNAVPGATMQVYLQALQRWDECAGDS